MCDKCPMKCTRGDYFKLHLKRHDEVEAGLRHNMPPRRNKNGHSKICTKHKCSVCDEPFPRLCQLRSHMSTIHGTELPAKEKPEYRYQCEVCGKRITHPAGVKTHLAEKHGIIKEGVKLFKCTEEGCDSVFYSKPKLEEHITMRKGEPRFHCSFCGKGFYSRLHLVRHELSLHINKETRPFVCKEKNCGKRFPIRGYLRLHERTQERKATDIYKEAVKTITSAGQ